MNILEDVLLPLEGGEEENDNRFPTLEEPAAMVKENDDIKTDLKIFNSRYKIELKLMIEYC